jgi:hypothetical protein
VIENGFEYYSEIPGPVVGPESPQFQEAVMATSQQSCEPRPRRYMTVIRPGMAPAQSTPVQSFTEVFKPRPAPRPPVTLPQVARQVMVVTVTIAEKTWFWGIVAFAAYCLFRMIII